MKNRVNSASIITRNEGLITADMDGEKVMLHIENGKYYALDSISSRIWELIEQPQSIACLVEALIKEYAVTRQQCQDDIIAFLQELYSQELIRLL